MAEDSTNSPNPEEDVTIFQRESLANFAPDDALEMPKGRLVRQNAFVVDMRPGERPHLHVRSVRPFEALFRAVPEGMAHSSAEDITPRLVEAVSPSGAVLSIHSVAALVMGDTDGFRAGETVWIGRSVADLLDKTERVLVCRGDGSPLVPMISKFIRII